MKRCPYCKKEYRINENLPKNASEFIREMIGELPTCDCIAKRSERERKDYLIRQKREMITKKVAKYRDMSIIDEKFKKSVFDCAKDTPVIQLVKQYAKKFTERPCELGIYIFGDVGCGKTFATACLANELMKNGFTVLATKLSSYISKIRGGDWDRTENELLEYVKKVDILIIDDVGTENTSDFTKEKVFNLIDSRYRAQKPIIITTNLDIASLGKHYDLRIADRIREMCLLYRVVGESKRMTGNIKFKNWIVG